VESALTDPSPAPSSHSASPSAADVWEVGEAYEAYVGRWSRLVAREFIPRLGVPPGGRWLDIGSGAGALSRAILDLASPSSVLGVDQSPAFVAHARTRIHDPRIAFEIGDARALPVRHAEFDAAVSGLVLNFVPPADQPAAAAEMLRAVRPGGAVGVYVWDYAGRMELLRYFWDAAARIVPACAELDEGRRFPICHPEALASLFRDAGAAAVEIRAIDVPTHFRDFHDLWQPFLGGQGPAPTYLATLPVDQQIAIRDQLRSIVPTEPNGSIHLIARAWAVSGTAPAR
jgi:SAM-dependent methyltransferase